MKPANIRRLPLESGKTYKVTYKRPEQRRLREFVGEYASEQGDEVLFWMGQRLIGIKSWWVVQSIETDKPHSGIRIL